jgi:hypothetical protein
MVTALRQAGAATAMTIVTTGLMRVIVDLNLVPEMVVARALVTICVLDDHTVARALACGQMTGAAMNHLSAAWARTVVTASLLALRVVLDMRIHPTQSS